MVTADPDSIDGQDPMFDLLASFAEELAKLKAQLNALTVIEAEPADEGLGAEASPAPPPPVNGNWKDRPKAEVAQAAIALVGWVVWLVGRYELAELLPQCWYRHGAMVEELVALHGAHVGAYSDSAPDDGPLAWHEAFDACRLRMHNWDIYGCCGGSKCRGGGPPVELSEVPADMIEVLVGEATRPPVSTPGRPRPPRPPTP